MKELNYPEAVGEEIDELRAVWSMGDRLLHWTGAAIDGKATIVYRDYWPNTNYATETIPQLSVKVEDPTYIDLMKAANDLIVESGDEHHIFVENFIYDETDDVWLLITGS